MDAQLIDTDDEHHWVLIDYRVAEVVAGTGWVAVRVWSLGGSFDVRVATTCALVLPSGARRELRPDNADSLAPLLALVGVGVRSLTTTRAGTTTVAFGDDSALELTRSGRPEAWEIEGGGVLEGMSYDAVGTGTPWAR